MSNDPYAGPRPDLSAVKKKIGTHGEATITPKSSILSPKTARMLGELEEDMRNRAENQEIQIELGEEYVAPDAVFPEYDSVYYTNTPIDNPEVRKAVEDRCAPMDFGDLVLSGRVVQRVPVLPGKFEPTYQSLLASDNAWVTEQVGIRDIPNWQATNWIGYARLTLSLSAINDNDFPAIVDKKGNIDEKKFDAKLKKIKSFSEHLVKLLLLNFVWFDARVERLLSEDLDLLKNG